MILTTFFGESELQLLGISILIALFGFSSLWESQNNMVQQMLFPSTCFDPGRTEVVKESDPKKLLPKKNWKQISVTYIYN